MQEVQAQTSQVQEMHEEVQERKEREMGQEKKGEKEKRKMVTNEKIRFQYYGNVRISD